MKVLNKLTIVVLVEIVTMVSTGCSLAKGGLVRDIMDEIKNKAGSFAEEKWQDIEDWATEESD